MWTLKYKNEKHNVWTFESKKEEDATYAALLAAEERGELDEFDSCKGTGGQLLKQFRQLRIMRTAVCRARTKAPSSRRKQLFPSMQVPVTAVAAKKEPPLAAAADKKEPPLVQLYVSPAKAAPVEDDVELQYSLAQVAEIEKIAGTVKHGMMLNAELGKSLHDVHQSGIDNPSPEMKKAVAAVATKKEPPVPAASKKQLGKKKAVVVRRMSKRLLKPRRSLRLKKSH